MFAKFRYYGVWLSFAGYDILHPTEMSKLVPFISVLLMRVCLSSLVMKQYEFE
jgi:hypothetical protein